MSSSDVAIWVDPAVGALRAELTRLIELLADTEAELLGLTVEVSAFSRIHSARLARLYAELDDLVARLAERTAQTSGDALDEHLAWEAREQARQTARDAAETPPEGEVAERRQQVREVQREMRESYRALARSCHPDLAGTDESERRLREEFMARVTAAYAAGDAAALQVAVEEWRCRISGARSLASADVELLQERIRSVRDRLAAVRVEIAALQASWPAQLCFAEDPDAALDNAESLLRAQITEHRATLEAPVGQ